MKLFKRLCVAFALLVLSVSVLVGAGLAFLTLYSRANVDSEADEALFYAARAGNVTRFYANAAPLGSADYIPVEIESYSHAKDRKLWYRMGAISPYLKEGFLAVEDREFYEHEGVNFRRTLAALINAIFKFEGRFGASTVTQQVIKNISGDDDISVKRKLNEILRALAIEKRHSKDEILELYLNIVPMGENAVGVGIASLLYFGKEPSELSVAEAATLIGITNAPTKYNPYDNKDACIKRRNTVLSAMLDCAVITKDEYERALDEKLELRPRADKSDAVNSWFIETVCDELAADLMKKYSLTEDVARHYIRGGGLTVYTTERHEVQKALEEILENTEELPPELALGLEYAAVALDSKTGNLLGIIGQAGKKEGERLLNHATVPHTPASTLKPLALYAPLIDSGRINAATVFDDSPLSYTEKGGEYIGYPKNSPDRYDGPITVERALMLSKNTVAMRLYEMLGGKRIYDSLKNDFNFDTLVNSASSTDVAPSPLALGQLTRGVSLLKLTAAYTVFPAEGVLNKQRSYIRVLDNKNEVILENAPVSERVFKKSTAQIMNMLLMGVTESGTARSITLKDTVDTAGKTGTSSLNRDKLFIGYTPYFTLGLWCGYADGKGEVYSLSPSHLELWDAIATELHRAELSGLSDSEIESFSVSELEYLPYCLDSGEIYGEECARDPRGDRLAWSYFSSDNKPFGECSAHTTNDSDFFGQNSTEWETRVSPSYTSFREKKRHSVSRR